MPTITVKPHHEICPDGATFDADAGETVCNALLAHGVHIEHACEKSCACTTCHVHVREGLDSMDEADELEEDYLDKAWGLDSQSRLSCQAVISNADLVIEIPKYTINMVSENH
ncbi:MAG: ISC system 2Fe-2S type ferredoxin [Gammaproteobacteria bacterium]|nr:ISC system 2Fe-2S type ferredoxin [Gammaproteobacteria bacterium]